MLANQRYKIVEGIAHILERNLVPFKDVDEIFAEAKRIARLAK